MAMTSRSSRLAISSTLSLSAACWSSCGVRTVQSGANELQKSPFSSEKVVNALVLMAIEPIFKIHGVVSLESKARLAIILQTGSPLTRTMSFQLDKSSSGRSRDFLKGKISLQLEHIPHSGIVRGEVVLSSLLPCEIAMTRILAAIAMSTTRIDSSSTTRSAPELHHWTTDGDRGQLAATGRQANESAPRQIPLRSAYDQSHTRRGQREESVHVAESPPTPTSISAIKVQLINHPQTLTRRSGLTAGRTARARCPTQTQKI